MTTIATRLLILACFMVFSGMSEVAFSMDGAGSGGTVSEKFSVKGCGSERWLGTITRFSMRYDGTWALTTSRSEFTGTYVDVKPDRSFNLTFSPSSYANLISGLTSASDDLCRLAPGTSALADVAVKSFVATTKKGTSVTLKLALTATRQGETSSNRLSYALKGTAGFAPSGCSGAAIGSLKGSDALVYCGNSEPAVITADNALELLSDVMGSGDATPVLSTASVESAQNDAAAGSLVQGVGTFAQRLARELFSSSLYSAAPAGHSLQSVPALSPQVQAASISINETDPCDSGTVTLRGKLSNVGIGALSVTFNACLIDGDVFNGPARFTINAFDMNYFTVTDALIEFELLSVSGDSGEIAMSGAIHDQLNIASNTETLTLDMVVSNTTANRVFKTENLVFATAYDSLMYPSSYSVSMSGRYFDSVYGYLDISTLQPLACSDLAQEYPDEGGSMLLTGAGNSTILFTVSTPTTSSLAVDADGDGVAETTTTIDTSAING